MSIVLDALRRGRESEGRPSNGKSAQTDAVLHTLGYRQSGQVTPARALRIIAVLAAAVLVFGWAFMKFAGAH